MVSWDAGDTTGVGFVVRTRIFKKFVDFVGVWEQSDQVDVGAADQRRFFSGRRRFQTFLVEAGQDKAVDRVARPRWVGDWGLGGAFDGLERPVAGGLACLGGHAAVRGPWQAHFDPASERGDLAGSQLGGGGHLQHVLPADGPNQPAFSRQAG